jgi:LuxR family maltose regulon positive regulatory protein
MTAVAKPTTMRPGALVPPPIGRTHVRRGRLDDLSEGALLVLVSAPAGSGKSVALSGWLHRRGNGGWYSLDDEDNDPAVFWPAVVAALGLEAVDAFDARGVARALFAEAG